MVGVYRGGLRLGSHPHLKYGASPVEGEEGDTLTPTLSLRERG